MTTTPGTLSAARQRTDYVQTRSCLRLLLAVEQDNDRVPDPMLACIKHIILSVTITGAALLDNNEATTKSTSQDGGMAGNFC